MDFDRRLLLVNLLIGKVSTKQKISGVVKIKKYNLTLEFNISFPNTILDFW